MVQEQRSHNNNLLIMRMAGIVNMHFRLLIVKNKCNIGALRTNYW
jgi:hypothetical protein